MDAIVAYYSKFGNTQKIAEAIADVFREQGSARLVPLEQLPASDLETIDLLVVGSPTHRMNLPEAVRPVFDSLPRRVLRGKGLAVLDTSYKMSGFLARFSAAPKLARKLRKLGGKQLVRPETFYVVGREGPLYEGEIERARTWARSILKARTS